MLLGTIIKEYRENNNLSMKEFADQCDLSKGYISMLENGVNPRNKKPIAPTIPSLKKIATGLGIDIDTLLRMMDGKQEISLKSNKNIKNISNVYPLELKSLPMLGEIACGEPKFANEDRESYVLAGTDIKADFCLKAKGNSMINARILDGDIIFIRKQDMVENGEIAAVVVSNQSEATLKRVYYYQDKALLILKAENPEYEDQIYSDEQLNEVHILGKAVAFQSDVR